MKDIENRARELLAAELDAIKFPAMAAEVRDESGYNSCGQAMVRAVIAAIAPQWQPIETAPTKGSFIVFGGSWVSESKDENDRQPSDVAHVNRSSGYRKFYVANSEEFWPYIDGPTHWMPLPEAP